MPCLSSGLPWVNPGGAPLHDEPARAGGRIRQHRVRVGDAAVADPLLAAVDTVSHDAAVFLHAVRRGLQGAQIAAGVGLGGAVGEQQALFGDARQPEFLLLRRGPDGDRVAAQKRRQDGGGDAQVDPRHLLADAVHVERAAAEAAELLRNEQELDAELVRAAHVPHDLQRAFVARVERDQLLVRQPLLGELLERFHAQFECLGVNHDRRLSFPGHSFPREPGRPVPAGTPGCRRRFPRPPPGKSAPWDSC